MVQEHRRERVRFRDIKPYFVPNSLTQLRGPYDGKIKLRKVVLWAPGDNVVNLDTTGGCHLAYQALLAEGKLEDQIQGLNRRRLIEEWPNLNLDLRVKELWEEKFPELRAT